MEPKVNKELFKIFIKNKGCKKKFEDPKKNASFKSIDCEFNAKK